MCPSADILRILDDYVTTEVGYAFKTNLLYLCGVRHLVGKSFKMELLTYFLEVSV